MEKTEMTQKVILEFYMEIWYCYKDEGGSMVDPLFTSTSYEMAEAEAKDAGYEVVQVIDFKDEELDEPAPIGEGVEGFTDFIPGEWNYKRQGFKITVGNNDTGATKNGHDYTVCIIEDNSFQAEANARLIASAPTLYRENKELKEMVLLLMSELGEYLDASDDQFGRESNNTYQSAAELLNRINK